MKPSFDFTDRPYIKAAAERTRAEIDRLNNPHEFRVVSFVDEDGACFIVATEGDEPIYPMRRYSSVDEANDAIGAMIADDDEDRRLNRNRHEQGAD